MTLLNVERGMLLNQKFAAKSSSKRWLTDEKLKSILHATLRSEVFIHSILKQNFICVERHAPIRAKIRW